MPAYDFECNNCGERIEITCSVKQIRKKELTTKCVICGTIMLRMFSINLGNRGDYRFESQSLAIAPSQIAEHRQSFPDVDVRSDGVLTFNSIKSQDDYYKKTGFYKVPQKIKKRKKS